MTIKLISRLGSFIVSFFLLFSPVGHAAEASGESVDSLNDWLAQGTFFGELKTMTFFKTYEGIIDDKRTHSFGGEFQYRSADLHGFSFGVGEYSAYNFGLNPSNPDETEGYVPSDNITMIGKAFLRYRGAGFDLKGGRIGLDTPFANEGDGRTMIPALYEGFGGTYALPFNPDIKVYGYRIFRFKPFSEDSFIKGDAGNPEIPETDTPQTDSNGFATAGVRWGHRYGANAEAWYYNFDKRLQLAYAGFQMPLDSLKMDSWTPFWALQYVKEWDVSDQAAPFENVDTDLYSGRVGINSRNDKIYLAATYVPHKDDAFLSGAYVAPYSYGIYNSTPIEDGQPLASMATKDQPGRSYSLRYVHHDDKLLAVLGLTRFELEESTGINYPLDESEFNAGFVILGYNVTDRFGLQFEGDYIDSDSDVTGAYHAERIRITYKLGNAPGHG